MEDLDYDLDLYDLYEWEEIDDGEATGGTGNAGDTGDSGSDEEKPSRPYGFKLTTHGRRVLAACAAKEKPLKLTRVDFGSGGVSEDTELADMHSLVHYEADGSIAERRHQDERLYLTVQYSNGDHKDKETFILSEFMVYAEDPDTGESTDFLYATLGDYIQPVPAYREGIPLSVFRYPMVITVSDATEVQITASPGLLTYDDLEQLIADGVVASALNIPELVSQAIAALSESGDLVVRENVTQVVKTEIRKLDTGSGLGGYGSYVYVGSWPMVIPADGWEAPEEENGDYGYFCDVALAQATAVLVPYCDCDVGYISIANEAGVLRQCGAYEGYIRFYAADVPEADISVLLTLYRHAEGEESVGTVEAGAGLSYDSLGKLNVNVGDGLSIDGGNNLTVDRETVLTGENLVDETEAEENLNTLLNGESGE